MDNHFTTIQKKKLPLPPADATAEAKEIMMKHCSDNGLLSMRLGKSILAAMHEFAAQRQPQPTAEEILYKTTLLGASVVDAMHEFAALTADKKLREGLIGYIDWYIHKGVIDEAITDEELIDEYLNERLPDIR